MTDLMTPARRAAQLAWLFLKNTAVNSGRRLCLLYLYTRVWGQQQGLRRWYRRLGEKIVTLQEAGDINPLLHEQVKDYLEGLRQRRERKAALYDRMAAVRERIRNTSYRLPASPAD